MITTITHDRMLELWMLRRYHEPLNDPLSIASDSEFGVDTMRLRSMEMREWYLNLLDNAPLEWLEVCDIKNEVALSVLPDGSGRIILPNECRRVVAVALASWEGRSATIVTPDSPLAMLQRSPYSRSGCSQPVAVVSQGAIAVYSPASPSDTISRLLCVKEPEASTYTFDERALSTIPPFNPSLP